MVDSSSQPATSSEGAPGASSEANNAATSASEPVQKPKLWKVKVDGKEAEVDEAELLRGYSHTSAANKRMQEAAQQRKAMEGLLADIETVRKNPKKLPEVLKKIGLDFDNLAHSHVHEKMRYELMSEEERENFDNKRELQALREWQQSQKAEEFKTTIQRQREQAMASLEDSFIQHASAVGERNPKVIERALEYVQRALMLRQDLPVPKAFELAKRDLEGANGEFMKARLAEMISRGEIPPELREAVRKADVAQLREQSPVRTSQNIKTEVRRVTEKPMTVDDWFDSKEKRK